MNRSTSKNHSAHFDLSVGAKIPCAVVGASGYSGRELVRLLLRHPYADLKACFSTTGQAVSAALPEKSTRQIENLPLSVLREHVESESFAMIFLATPAGVSIELAAMILKHARQPIHVIDLSGAFRLKAGSTQEISQNYKSWYQIDHPALDLVGRAEYGLVPWQSELQPSQNTAQQAGQATARLIANPGCYATAILMGLLPLLKAGLIDANSLVIDAKSGTTGAGKKAEEHLLYSEVEGNCTPYRIGRHQHQPEIMQFAQAFSGVAIDPHFTPHLLNVRRGIIAGLYARLNSGVTVAQIESAFAAAYASDPLVEFGCVQGNEHLLSLRRVVGSARTQISYQVEQNKLYVFSLIDNLLKGAASQAVENFNRVFALPSCTGLLAEEGVL